MPTNQTSTVSDSNIRKALDLAGRHLHAFAKDVVSANNERRWAATSQKHVSGDVSDAVGAILNNWDCGFSGRYSDRAKDYLRDIRELRNKWAHPAINAEFSRDDAFRLLDSIGRVFTEFRIDAPSALAAIETFKAELLTAPQPERAVEVAIVEKPTAAPDTPPQLPASRPNALKVQLQGAAVLTLVTLLIVPVLAYTLPGERAPSPGPSQVAVPAVKAPSKKPSTAPPTASKKPPTAKEARLSGMRYYSAGEAHFERTGDLHARDVLFRQAIERFKKARILAPTDPEPVFNQAVVLEAMNRREEALPLFQRVVVLSGSKTSHIKSKAEDSVIRIKRVLAR